MARIKTFSGRPASQAPEELSGFIDLLKSREITSYLEIGARDGDTFHAVMSAIPAGSVGVAVDLPGGPWGYEDSAAHLQAAAADLRDSGYEIEVVLGDSSDSDVYSKVEEFAEKHLSGGLFDVVFIDADHRYAAVKSDFEIWGGIAQIVALHDIAGHDVVQKTSGLKVQVPKFWSKIKRSRESVEFIDPDRLMGIGVLL